MRANYESDNRTLRAVERQIRASGCQMFEVGLFKPDAEGAGPVMIPRVWDSDALLRSVSWLRLQNRDGRNIFCRPKGEHHLSLVDDVRAETVMEMKRAGFEPALVVETSPKNFQVWLNHGRTLPSGLSTLVAKALAKQFGGDSGAADWHHFGRLSGFTNRKLLHFDVETGLYPFVRLIEDRGGVYRHAADFVNSVQVAMEQAIKEREARLQQHYSGAVRSASLKSIEEFRVDSRYDGDGTRIDLAYAIYALSHGLSVEHVSAAIRSRDLSHKGSDKRQAEYIERTIKKALNAAERGPLGR